MRIPSGLCGHSHHSPISNRLRRIRSNPQSILDSSQVSKAKHSNLEDLNHYFDGPVVSAPCDALSPHMRKVVLGSQASHSLFSFLGICKGFKHSESKAN